MTFYGDDIYYHNKKIAIDGACAYGGQLNCLEIKDEMYTQYSISHDFKIKKHLEPKGGDVFVSN